MAFADGCFSPIAVWHGAVSGDVNGQPVSGIARLEIKQYNRPNAGVNLRTIIRVEYSTSGTDWQVAGFTSEVAEFWTRSMDGGDGCDLESWNVPNQLGQRWQG